MSCVYKLNEIPGFGELLLNSDDLKQNIIKQKDFTTIFNQNYKIIFYDRDYLSDSICIIYGLLKSVVINCKNEVVGFFPPKSLDYEYFYKTNTEINDIIVEELIDGFQINVFWDNSIGLNGGWQISTMMNVGCHEIYSNGKKITDIFTEIFMKSNMEWDVLEKRYCYNFVLQHKDIDLVKSVETPQMYLIKVYEIVNTADGTVNIFPVDISQFKESSYFFHIKFPKVYDSFKSYDDITKECNSMSISCKIKGLNIYNKKTHLRSKLINPNYDYVKHMKFSLFFDKNYLKLQYYYFTLRKENKVSSFLDKQPKYKNDFLFFKKYLYIFTESLFILYNKCYVIKEYKITDYSNIFYLHIKLLHQKYIKNLKNKNLCVTKKFVIDYVNELSPEMLMCMLNSQ